MTQSTHTPKIGRYLGISLFSIGACFLFDPFFGVFDILPDAIGYLLMCLGLYRFSDLDDRMADAFRAAGRLALLGVARILCLVLAYGLVSPAERPTFTLLMLFILGVLDALCFIPLWRHFGNGLIYLGSRNGATVLFRQGGRFRARSMTERYVSFSIVAFIIREVAVILPECTVLTDQSGGAESNAHTLYTYVGLFRVAGIALFFVIGVAWLICTFVFLGRIKSDRPFFENLLRKYETEVLVRKDLFAMRAIKAALVSLVVATVFSLDFYLEGVDILPDFLTAVMLVLAVCLLHRHVPRIGAALAASVAYGVTAAFGWVYQIRYLNLEEALDAFEDPLLLERRGVMSFLQVLAAILFVLSFALILKTLYTLTRHHTGVRTFRESDARAYVAERTEAIHLSIRKKLVAVGILAVLAAGSTLFQWLVVPTLPDLVYVGYPSAIDAVIDSLYAGLREAYWGIDLIVGCVLAGLTIHAGSEIFEQMDYTYLMK